SKESASVKIVSETPSKVKGGEAKSSTRGQSEAADKPIEYRCADPQSMVDAARVLIARGYELVPLHYGTKIPIPKRFPVRHFGAEAFYGTNIGILTGVRNRDLTGLDFDADKTREAAASGKYLRDTSMIDGRASKPGSHWLHRV